MFRRYPGKAHPITFDRAVITAQLELKEASWWDEHHQRWPKNDLASLKSGVFVSSVERCPYQGFNYALYAHRGRAHAKWDSVGIGCGLCLLERPM